MEIVQQAHVIHVAEMSDPLTRLAKKLDQLTVVVNKVSEGFTPIVFDHRQFCSALQPSPRSHCMERNDGIIVGLDSRMRSNHDDIELRKRSICFAIFYLLCLTVVLILFNCVSLEAR